MKDSKKIVFVFVKVSIAFIDENCALLIKMYKIQIYCDVLLNETN